MRRKSDTGDGSRCHVKICGLSRPEDVAYVNEARRTLGGPDFAGFIVNVPGSRRSITEERLRQLTALLDPEITAVGVFVDEEPGVIARLLAEGVIGACQLHGSEDAEYIRALRERIGQPAGPGDSPMIIKAFRPADGSSNRSSNGRSSGLSEASAEEIAHCPADLVLLDSGAGSGQTFDWSTLRDADGAGRIGRDFLLAGGLTPENIPEAGAAVRPWGIDLSSGVETDGVKDRGKILAAVRAAMGGSLHPAGRYGPEQSGIDRETHK
ncbi:MAG: phosphoribosylanthranilate isomerase [Lachnospiraceae bacterium]|nr:phosphoribosylanthranilate isomerase [Lachnospiraceae bacterium]